jgi:hypothetical protein
MELPNKISECAFGKKSEVCSSEEIIQKMKEFLEKNGINASLASPIDVVNKLKDTLDCDVESCVLKNRKFSNFVGSTKIKENLAENFKPEGPALTFDLLSNFNIDDVLDQFEKAYSSQGFVHIPFQMRDFAKYAPSEREIKKEAHGSTEAELKGKRKNLATVDWAEEYNRGMRCAGVVLNTDYSSGNGIHWFCLFMDFRTRPYTIEYFNSSGNLPLYEIAFWMKETRQKLIDEMGLEVDDIKDVVVSRIVHQYDKHSCGIYVLYYILSRLNGVPYKYFQENKISDKLMHEFRKVFFRFY